MPHASFSYGNIYLSGHLYYLARGMSQSEWVALKAWRSSSKKDDGTHSANSLSDLIEDAALKSQISYHLSTNPLTNEDHLLKQARSYLALFHHKFSLSKPDLVLCIGDSRLAICCAITVAKHLGIAVRYLEQAPFGTTFYTADGVNANTIVVPEEIDTSDIHELRNKIAKTTKDTYCRSPLYRGMDHIFELLFKKTKHHPPDLILNGPSSKSSVRSRKIESADGDHSILLILQVPHDVNFIHHNSLYKDMTSVVVDVFNALPEATKLIIREHPKYKGRYDKSMYDFIADNHIQVDNTTPLKIALQNTTSVVTINSTVGIEAIAMGKPLVLLGRSYYGHSELCLTVDGKEHLRSSLKRSLFWRPSEVHVFRFLKGLYGQKLVDGRYNEADLTAAKSIAMKILSEFH